MANPETIKEFLVKVGFKVDKTSFGKFNEVLNKATKSVTKLGAATLAASGAVLKFTESVAKDFERVSLISDRIGVPIQAIQKLGYEASLTGSNVEAAESALQSINKAAGDARLGIGTARIWFERLRVSVFNSNGQARNAADILKDVGVAIKGLDKPTQIAALNQLGIDQTLIKTLTSDLSELSAEFDNIYKAAGINADEAAKKSIKFMDSMKKLKFSLGVVGKAIGLEFSDRIIDSMDEFRRWIDNNIPKIIDNIKPIVENILEIINDIRILSSAFIEGFSKINELTGGFAGKIVALIAAWKLLNLSFLATPIGLIITGITAIVAALGLLIDDLYVFEQGGHSFLNWDKFLYPINAVKHAIDALVNSIKYLIELGEKFANSNFFGKVKDSASGFISSINEDLKSGFNNIGFNTPGLALAGVSPKSAINNVSNSPVLNQQTNITVNGATNPQATATDINSRQERVNQNLVRNMRGNVR